MTNGSILVLLLLFSTIRSAPFVFSSDAYLNFSENTQPITYSKTNINGLDYSNATAWENISRTLKYWDFNYQQKINENTTQIYQGQSERPCNPKILSFQQIITQVTKVNYDANTLLPATLIQLKSPSGFSNGVIATFLPDSKRNPISIILSNGIKDSFVTNPNQRAIVQKMSQIAGKYTAYLEKQPIMVYIQKGSNIEPVLKQLGLSTKTYQDLLLSGSTPELGGKNQGRIVVVFIQKLFSASLDLTKNGSQSVVDLVQNVFSSQYTFDEFMQSSNYGYWGPGNLPQLVSQTNYGRLLVFSLYNNLRNRAIVDQLQKCFSQSKSQPSEACIDSSMIQIQRNPTARYYVGGVDSVAVTERYSGSLSYKSFVNWKKVFSSFDSPKSIENLRPLSANLINLLGKKYSQVETRYYSILTCSKVPDIKIKITQIDGYCMAYMKGQNEKSFSKVLFDTFNPQTFQIGTKTGWQPFEIKFVLRGRRLISSLFGLFKKVRYNHKLTLTFIINGVEKKTLDVGNPRDETQNREYVFKVSPMSGSVL